MAQPGPTPASATAHDGPASAPDAIDYFLRRAIRLAVNARGHVEPNPLVGCIITRDVSPTPPSTAPEPRSADAPAPPRQREGEAPVRLNAPTSAELHAIAEPTHPSSSEAPASLPPIPAQIRILGEGYHRRYGGPHAEPDALAAVVAAGHSPAGSTVYVTLEPCCHTGAAKKTPPCVPRLIEAKVARVVVGCLDPNPAVHGQGVAALRAAGIDVTVAAACGEPGRTGPVAAACQQLIAPFTAHTVHRRPYVTLKWAQTANGKVAGPGGARLAITGPESNRLVHALRSRCDAILVGVNTVLADDPMLTVRGVDPVRPLLRVVIDRELRLPPRSRLVQTLDQAPLLVYCDDESYQEELNSLDTLAAAGVNVVPLPVQSGVSESGLYLPALVEDLGRRGVTHLLVEGGPTTHAHFIGQNLADRLWVFRSPREMSDPTAPAAAPVPPDYVETGTISVGDDTLTEYLNPKSDVFFAADPSPDFVLAAEQ